MQKMMNEAEAAKMEKFINFNIKRKRRKMKKQTKCALGLGIAGLTVMTAPLTNLGSESASAACGYGVFAENFYAPCNQGERVDGAIAVQTEEIEGERVMRITLNNYQGSGIYYECCASCPDKFFDKVIVELKGENKITERKGTGITFNDVEFAGTGKLTIEAMIPVGGRTLVSCGDPDKPMYDRNIDNDALGKVIGVTTLEVDMADNSVIEKPSGEPGEDADNEEKPDSADGEKTEDGADKDVVATEKENPWTAEMLTIHIAAGIYIVLSLVTFILLGIRKLTRKHQPKTNKKIIIEENGKKVGETEIEEGEEKQE